MTYQLPSYIVSANINPPEVSYNWDDSDVESYLNYDYANMMTDKIDRVSWRGKATLIIGVYEWILGRFQGLCPYPVYFQMAEAAYCGSINQYYLIPHYQLDNLKIDRSDYLGPVDGALWCAGRSSLLPGFYIADSSSKLDEDAYEDDYAHYTLHKWRDDLAFLIALTLHILPQDKVNLFTVWLEGVTTRLLEFYIQPEEDPFANIFGHKNNTDWLGDYVAREVLDLAQEYKPASAIILCDNYLQSVDYENNPFLLPPKKIVKNKVRVPYRLSD